jgi:hypothetical protein
VLISVLTRGVEDREKAESAIAEIARYAYDYFQFAVHQKLEKEPFS